MTYFHVMTWSKVAKTLDNLRALKYRCPHHILCPKYKLHKVATSLRLFDPTTKDKGNNYGDQ